MQGNLHFLYISYNVDNTMYRDVEELYEVLTQRD